VGCAPTHVHRPDSCNVADAEVPGNLLAYLLSKVVAWVTISVTRWSRAELSAAGPAQGSTVASDVLLPGERITELAQAGPHRADAEPPGPPCLIAVSQYRQLTPRHETLCRLRALRRVNAAGLCGLPRTIARDLAKPQPSLRCRLPVGQSARSRVNTDKETRP